RACRYRAAAASRGAAGSYRLAAAAAGAPQTHGRGCYRRGCSGLASWQRFGQTARGRAAARPPRAGHTAGGRRGAGRLPAGPRAGARPAAKWAGCATLPP
nr:hypothetical protein [Tanacetum cinerariifolium]